VLSLLSHSRQRLAGFRHGAAARTSLTAIFEFNKHARPLACRYNISSIEAQASRVASLIEHEQTTGTIANKDTYLAGFSEGGKSISPLFVCEPARSGPLAPSPLSAPCRLWGRPSSHTTTQRCHNDVTTLTRN